MARKITVTAELDDRLSGAVRAMVDKSKVTIGALGGAFAGVRTAYGEMKDFILGSPLGGLLAFEGIMGGFRALRGAIGDVIAASAEAQAAESGLSAALRSLGVTSQGATQALLAQASAFQRVSIFGDDAVVGVQTLLLNLGVLPGQMQEAVQATLDYAAATGKDATTAARELGVTLTGQAGPLSRYVGQVRGLTEEQLRAGEAFKVVGAVFSGQAAAKLDTFAGSAAALRNAWGDLLERLGDAIVLNPDVNKLIEDVLAFVQEATPLMGQIADRIGPAIVRWVREAFDGLGTTIEKVNSVNAVFNKIAQVLSIVSQLVQLIVGGLDILQKSAIVIFHILEGGIDTLVASITRRLPESVQDFLGIDPEEWQRSADAAFGVADVFFKKVEMESVGLKKVGDDLLENLKTLLDPVPDLISEGAVRAALSIETAALDAADAVIRASRSATDVVVSDQAAQAGALDRTAAAANGVASALQSLAIAGTNLRVSELFAGEFAAGGTARGFEGGGERTFIPGQEGLIPGRSTRLVDNPAAPFPQVIGGFLFSPNGGAGAGTTVVNVNTPAAVVTDRASAQRFGDAVAEAAALAPRVRPRTPLEANPGLAFRRTPPPTTLAAAVS